MIGRAMNDTLYPAFPDFDAQLYPPDMDYSFGHNNTVAQIQQTAMEISPMGSGAKSVDILEDPYEAMLWYGMPTSMPNISDYAI